MQLSEQWMDIYFSWQRTVCKLYEALGLDPDNETLDAKPPLRLGNFLAAKGNNRKQEKGWNGFLINYGEKKKVQTEEPIFNYVGYEPLLIFWQILLTSTQIAGNQNISPDVMVGPFWLASCLTPILGQG